MLDFTGKKQNHSTIVLAQKFLNAYNLKKQNLNCKNSIIKKRNLIIRYSIKSRRQ